MSLANHFVKGNFYLGISDHYEEKERAMNRALLSTYEEISVPVVALQDVRYLDEDDYEAFDCLRSMDEGRRWVREEISEQKKHRHFRSAKSEEHTSELQSRGHLVCRLLLEKKNETQ